MAKPSMINPIPDQVVNELASYGPFDLKNFIRPAEGGPALRYSAALKDHRPLPTGMILTGDGILTGIPAKGTQGIYEVVVTAGEGPDAITAGFIFTVKPSLENKEAAYLDKLKSQIWEALDQRLPLPDSGAFELPITELDIYYLLERWGTLTIWDAFNLDPPSQKIALNLPGASPHYHVFDRGSSVIMAPVDLFSYERGIQDGVVTARALAQEIYKRGWTIEMAGLDKWIRTAWIEFQQLGDQYGKHLEIINYIPSAEEINAYSARALSMSMLKKSPE
jgi:hypothetical protein